MDQLTARRVAVEVIDGVDAVALGEWPDGTGWSLVFQADDDGYHISNHLGVGVVNAIREWSVSGRGLHLHFTDEGRASFGSDGLTISMHEDVNLRSAHRALRRLLSGPRPN
jgi:hypothetical protein